MQKVDPQSQNIISHHLTILIFKKLPNRSYRLRTYTVSLVDRIRTWHKMLIRQRICALLCWGIECDVITYNASMRAQRHRKGKIEMKPAVHFFFQVVACHIKDDVILNRNVP